ncbi:MAG TPA: hypothetical protein VIT65_13240 [Microlunatus sp.]
MTLAFALQAVRRHIALILITVLVVAGAGVLIGSSWPKTYTSNAQMLMGLDLKGSTMDPATANLYLKDRMATYAELVTADQVISPVAEALAIPPQDLRKRTVVAIVPETVVLEVSVTASSPQEAVRLTQAVTERFGKQVSSYNVETGGPRMLPAQLSDPLPAVEPDQLHGNMLVAVSGLVGLVIGVVLALLVALIGSSRAKVRLARSAEKAHLDATSTGENPSDDHASRTPSRAPATKDDSSAAVAERHELSWD